ncbi:hypothetical protein BHM03_00055151 [Ensete ventricosum]|nr:hypothetical protein BHM03_00055151 [Ensete ventricosum]
MCISVDALEAGLWFPLHPLIEECPRWWRISPNQVAPNSWRYLIVFLGECRGAGIIPTRDLFMACFRLCKSRGGYYLTTRVGFRVSGVPSNNKGWKSHYLFVSGPVWGFKLDWSAHPIGNVSPYLSEEEFILVGRLKGIFSASCMIKEMTELWLVEAGLSPASRGTVILPYFSFSNRMDLDELRGMPKVSGGKALSTRPAAREVDTSPSREAPKASSKRPIDAPAEQVDNPARRHKKVKVLTRRHKSRHCEGESRSRSKGKEPAAPSEELNTPAKILHPANVRPGASRPRQRNEGQMERVKELDESLERLVGSGVIREGTSPPSTGAGAIHGPLGGLAGPSCQGNGFAGTRRPEVWRRSGGGRQGRGACNRIPVSELQQELEKTKSERDEALLRCEASEKELNEVRSNLAEVHRLLKEARVRARKMDNELLQAVKALESARAELPRQAIVQYKESAGFKEGLKRMG